MAKSILEPLYREVKQELDKLNQELIDELEDFVDGFEIKNRILVEDIDKVSEYLERMDRFFKEKTSPFLAFLALKITEALELSKSQFAKHEPEFEDVEHILDVFGIEDGKIKPKRDGKMTLLFAIGSLKVLENDIIYLIHNAFNGEVARVDLKKAVVNTANRKFHDFFETYAMGSVFHSFNTAQRIYAQKYKYKKFLYSGGIIEESRDFCVERAGHEFWFDDGLSWNEMDWRGKIPGVDFFVQVGGYNCLHHIEWIE
jgi:hypothetical protein